MKKTKIKSMTMYAMFIAVEITLVVVPFLGYIPIGPLRATTLHIPVLIAGIVLGKKGGAFIGLVFGLSSLFYNTINPTVTSFVFSPFISGNIVSAIIAIVPRVLIGYLAGFCFAILQKKSKHLNLNILISCMLGALTNTVLVLLGIYTLFGSDYSNAIGKSLQELSVYFIGIVSTQGIIEAIVGSIIALFVCRPLISFMKRG